MYYVAQWFRDMFMGRIRRESSDGTDSDRPVGREVRADGSHLRSEFHYHRRELERLDWGVSGWRTRKGTRGRGLFRWNVGFPSRIWRALHIVSPYRYFPSRELVVRTENSLLRFRLSTWLQIGAAALALVVVVGGVTSSVIAWQKLMESERQARSLLEVRQSFAEVRRAALSMRLDIQRVSDQTALLSRSIEPTAKNPQAQTTQRFQDEWLGGVIPTPLKRVVGTENLLAPIPGASLVKPKPEQAVSQVEQFGLTSAAALTSLEQAHSRLNQVVTELEQDLVSRETDFDLEELSQELPVVRRLKSRVDQLIASRDHNRFYQEQVAQDLDRVMDHLGGLVGQSERIGYTAPVQDVQQRLVDVGRMVGELENLQLRQRANVDKFLKVATRNVRQKLAWLGRAGIDPQTWLGELYTEFASGQGGPLDLIVNTTSNGPDLVTGQRSMTVVLRMQEKLEQYARCIPVLAPLENWHLTSGFGVRRDPMTKRKAFHYGMDMGQRSGSPIYSPLPGRVVFSGWSGPYGNMIEIDHGCGIRTRYGHLKTRNTKKGDLVAARDKVGLVGNTGRSSGPHLHYEVIVNGEHIDPLAVIRSAAFVFNS